MKKALTIFLLGGLFFVLTACNQLDFYGCNSVCLRRQAVKAKQVEINGQQLKVEVAVSDKAKAKGLSGRLTMGENQAMLFVFKEPVKIGFWMKDMHFPLDIVWILDQRVVAITKKVPVEKNNQNLKIYYPPQPINYVLEVGAGWTDKYHIKIGDKIKYGG